jgi:probable DNA metabolism protein
MLQLLYDGTMAGFLSAIFEAYERRAVDKAGIAKAALATQDVFAYPVHIETDALKALRVWKGLSKKLSPAGLDAFYYCWLSELPGTENTLLAYARYAIASERSIEEDYGNKIVLEVSQNARKVWREKHRMEAFVRFRLLKDNIFFAAIEPDYDVLPLILPHFRSRYADQHWLIYDLRRRRGIYYSKDTEQVEEVEMEWQEGEGNDSPYDEAEMGYQQLWQDYFKHTGIPERKNPKLHLRHMPRRYWRHLTEKQA